MTPLEIEIALHYYYTPLPYPNMPMRDGIVDAFLAAGLLQPREGEYPPDWSKYERTDRLTAYCKALQAVPLPVQKWVAP
jgi:hypothetical protein